jgi:hypothetical protein
MARSNGYTVTGTIRLIEDTKQVSDKFRKRLFVITVPDGKYDQTLPIEATGDACDLLNEYGEGDEVKVETNVRGREWKSPSGETKFFLSLQAWKIERVGAAKASSTPKPTGPNGSGSDDDSLPF